MSLASGERADSDPEGFVSAWMRERAGHAGARHRHRRQRLADQARLGRSLRARRRIDSARVETRRATIEQAVARGAGAPGNPTAVGRGIVNQAKRTAIFERFRKANPAPTTELAYRSAFELLVAVVLSAQATDVSVNKATRGLFKKARSPRGMLRLGEAGVREHIRTIGLFNAKAKNIIAACQQLVADHDGEVPRSREALEALPGVGRKTANVIMNTAFGEPTIAVDTHIFRVSNRTRIAPGKNVKLVEEKLLRAVPEEYKLNAHHWLILHGRYVLHRPRSEVR